MASFLKEESTFLIDPDASSFEANDPSLCSIIFLSLINQIANGYRMIFDREIPLQVRVLEAKIL